MKLKIIPIAVLLTVTCIVAGQTTNDLNKTDQQGRKQGHWIKKYPNGHTLYEGNFLNDKPVGEFKRYNADQTIRSILIYSNNSREADATIYHPNGFISSRGRYIDQLKEGTWKFYSATIDGFVINEEVYLKNLRHGPSLKYYPDSTLSEKLNYTGGIKDGEWKQYHPNGKIFLTATFIKGELDGKFEAWYDTGTPQYKGTYRRNLREGKWQIFDEKGVLKYELNYTNGITKNSQMDSESAKFFERIEKNKGKIADPEKTGNIR